MVRPGQQELVEADCYFPRLSIGIKILSIIDYNRIDLMMGN